MIHIAKVYEVPNHPDTPISDLCLYHDRIQGDRLNISNNINYKRVILKKGQTNCLI